MLESVKIDLGGGQRLVTITARCELCQALAQLKVTEDEWLHWLSGALVQNALESLRGLLVLGHCAVCFKIVTPED